MIPLWSEAQLGQHRYSLMRKHRRLSMGSWFSDQTGVDVNVNAGLENVANQINEGLKHLNKQLVDGLEHVKNQLSEQLGFSIDLTGFVKNSIISISTIIKGIANLDWNTIAKGFTDLSHSVGQFLVEINPFNSYWLFLTQGKAVGSDIHKAMLAVDGFFGNAISGAIAFTTLPARGLRGDAITAEEIVHDLLSAIAICLIVFYGPVILTYLGQAAAWVATTGIQYAWLGIKGVVEWITGKKAEDALGDIARNELLKGDGDTPGGPSAGVAPAPAPTPGTSTMTVQPQNNTLAILGVGAVGVILWSLT